MSNTYFEWEFMLERHIFSLYTVVTLEKDIALELRVLSYFLAVACEENISEALQQQYPLIHYHLFNGNGENVRERLEKVCWILVL